jgi:hypothetical protein
MRFRVLATGALAGGLFLFLWGAVYNAFSSRTLQTFTNDAEVVESIRRNAPANGIYLSDKGVFAAIDVKPDGSLRVPSLGPFMVRELLADLAIGLLLTFVLMQLRPTSLPRPFVLAAIALAAGIALPVSDWNWFGFDPRFTVASIGEVVFGWMLAGFLLVRIVDRGRKADHGSGITDQGATVSGVYAGRA